MTMSLEETASSVDNSTRPENHPLASLSDPDDKPLASVDPMRQIGQNDRDDPKDSSDRRVQVPLPGESSTTTFTSETDDGDYETSSEGPARAHENNEIKAEFSGRSHPRNSGQEDASFDQTTSCKKSAPTRERKSALDETKQMNVNEKLIWIKDATFEKHNTLLDLPIKSESLPIMTNVENNSLDLEEKRLVEVALTSESSFACGKKMKMIMTYMDSLMMSEMDARTERKDSTSRTEVPNKQYEAKKFESRTTLPTLENFQVDVNRPKEVTFLDTERYHDDRESNFRHSSYSAHRSTSDARATELNSNNGDELIDIAENPHPSIKSFYFPPTPLEVSSEQDTSSVIEARKQQSRVSSNMNALLRIDGELGPLRHRLSEITGKFRALNLSGTPLDLMSARKTEHQSYPGRAALSPNSSGYFLRRAEHFDSSKDRVVQESFVGKARSQVPSFAVVGKSASYRSAESSADINEFDENRSYHRQDRPVGPVVNAQDKRAVNKGSLTYRVKYQDASDMRNVRYVGVGVGPYALPERNEILYKDRAVAAELDKQRDGVEKKNMGSLTFRLHGNESRSVRYADMGVDPYRMSSTDAERWYDAQSYGGGSKVVVDDHVPSSSSKNDRIAERMFRENCSRHSQISTRSEYYSRGYPAQTGHNLYESSNAYLPYTLGMDPALNRESRNFHVNRNTSKCVHAIEDAVVPQQNSGKSVEHALHQHEVSKFRANSMGSDVNWPDFHAEMASLTKISQDDFRKRSVVIHDDGRSDRQIVSVGKDNKNPSTMSAQSKTSSVSKSVISRPTRIGSVNTDLTAIVEKRYSERAVSPIRDLAPTTKVVTSSEASTDPIIFPSKHSHDRRKFSRRHHHLANDSVHDASSMTAQKSLTFDQSDSSKIPHVHRCSKHSRNDVSEQKGHRHSMSSMNPVHSTKLLYAHNANKSASTTFHNSKSSNRLGIEKDKDPETFLTDTQTSAHRSSYKKNFRSKNLTESKSISVQIPDTVKKYRDLAVQISSTNIKCYHPEITIPQSLQSLLKPYDSYDGPQSESAGTEIQMPNSDEKIVIIPVIFTSGIPDPPKCPLFSFAKPQSPHQTTPSHHVVTIERRNPRRSFSTLSGGSMQYPGSYKYEDSTYGPEHWTPMGKTSNSCLNPSMSSMNTRNTSSSLYLGRCSTTSTRNVQKVARVTSGAIIERRGSTESNEREDMPVPKVIRGMRSSPEDFLCDT